MIQQELKHVLNESHIQNETIYNLLKQGIEVEKIKLQFYEAAKSDSLDSYMSITEGECFLSLLVASRAI